MSFAWFLFYAVVIFLALNAWFVYNEKYQWRISWPYPSSWNEMVNIAKKKKDHEMDDEEFNKKYAAFRHESGRASLWNRQTLNKFNTILHYIEVYLFHGGPSRLAKKYPIKQPIFIIGDFRSGTSVLERLITHHSDMTYFTMSQQVLWGGPNVWNRFLGWMGFIRGNLLGHPAWNRPGDKGMYYPHSSNVLLTRGRPFEIEILWESCKRNLQYKRNNKWETLDDIDKNADNNCNLDVVDETLNDPVFESLFLNSVRLLLSASNSKNPRFILKNPLNGYRVRYLHKLFPDAKFIHIARNPLKTTLSQIRMAEANLRCCFMTDKECRENNNKPPKKESIYSWNKVFNNQYPNQFSGTLWWPRQFPRTKPEYHEITKYIKADKYNCAVATAVIQQERVALDAFKQIGAVEGQNIFTIWHEDILENAEAAFEKVMKYLNLKCTKQERLDWLEMEDFPGGQANKKRVKQSNKTEKSIDFGKDSKEVTQIIENSDAMKRYRARKQVMSHFNPTDESEDDAKENTSGNGVSH